MGEFDQQRDTRIKVNMDPITSILTGEHFLGVMKVIEKSGDQKALQHLKGLQDEIEKLPEIFLKMKEKIKQEVTEELKQDYDAKIGRMMETMVVLSTDLKEEKKKRLANECKAMETTIFLVGLTRHPKALNEKRPETGEETYECLCKLLNELDCPKLKDDIHYLVRLPPKLKVNKDGEEFSTNVCKLVFNKVENKRTFFGKLQANGGKITDLRVYEGLPKELLTAKANLETIAKKIRSNEEGTRTRVQARNGELVLMIKKGKDGKFERMERKDLEKELRWLKEKKTEENRTKRPREEDQEQNQNSAHSERKPAPTTKTSWSSQNTTTAGKDISST